MIRYEAPEDFRVEELPLFAPSGEGDHTYVRVEKRLRTTEEVARALARAAGVPPRDVGYAGRKDRFAVTTQWLSVPKLAPDQALALEIPGATVLEALRHGHKLRTGQLRGNRFELRVPEIDERAAQAAVARLELLVRQGMPNRFGAQRFGSEGDNAEAGRRVLAGKLAVRDRRRARFLVSAFQAAVFNAVLEARAPALSRLEEGDVAVVHESGGLFVVEDPVVEQPRADRFEISPTGPIFGTRSESPRAGAAETEQAVLSRCGVPEPLEAPRGIRLRGGRRALRVSPGDAEARAESGFLHLSFALPPGSYASVLVEELLRVDA